MIVVTLKKLLDVWFGVALDRQKRVISCSFSIENKLRVIDQIFGSIPFGETVKEEYDDEYALSILESLGYIFQGKDPKVVPELAWYRLPSFHREALKLTAKIPRGLVATYGGIAAGIGKPRAARAVGNAQAGNPFAPLVPCHRVVSSTLGLGGYGGGLSLKRAFLQKEGVQFKDGKVSPNCVWVPKPNKS